mmetsp:Transcript_66019/g.137863  ORF Transcript_66019/g.137863 Transcript_66019/m.137863 type:complete len:204 (+) Transcript_66019:1209-1820(+)
MKPGSCPGGQEMEESDAHRPRTELKELVNRRTRQGGEATLRVAEVEYGSRPVHQKIELTNGLANVHPVLRCPVLELSPGGGPAFRLLPPRLFTSMVVVVAVHMQVALEQKQHVGGSLLRGQHVLAVLELFDFCGLQDRVDRANMASLLPGLAQEERKDLFWAELGELLRSQRQTGEICGNHDLLFETEVSRKRLKDDQGNTNA